MGVINSEFTKEEERLRRESQIFYEAEGLDPSIVPEFNIDIYNYSTNKGQLEVNEEEMVLTIFPEIEHQNHRITEGNTTNLVIDDVDSRIIGIHETAHVYFDKAFDNTERAVNTITRLPEGFYEETAELMVEKVTSNLKSKTMDEIKKMEEQLFQGQIGLEQLFETDRIARNTRISYLKEHSEVNLARDYETMIALNGINEVAARIMSLRFLGNDQPTHTELFRDDYVGEGTNMVSHDFQYSLGQEADVSNVRTGELADYINDEGFDELLSLDTGVVLDRFYNELEI